MIQALVEGDRSTLIDATNDLISDVSPESWEGFLSARERVLRESLLGEDQI